MCECTYSFIQKEPTVLQCVIQVRTSVSESSGFVWFLTGFGLGSVWVLTHFTFGFGVHQPM